MKNPQPQSGFTIIETLVAITILMIAIAGPLTIAHKGLLAAVYARDQVMASFLAQDAMEFIKNVRDNNVRKDPSTTNWLDGFDGCIASSAGGVTGYCTVDTVNGDPNVPSGITGGLDCSSGNNCALYNDTNGYTPTPNNTRPVYKRYFYIIQLSNPDEAKAVVIVSWTNGGVPNQVLYENEMFNITK